MKNTIVSFSVITLVISSMLGMPLSLVNAESDGVGSLNASVTGAVTNYLTINSITVVKTSGTPDGTFGGGWQWVFDITIPNRTETNLAMKFDDWLRVGGSSNAIPVAGNLRIYSAQSSNANSQGSAIYINSPGVYSNFMTITGDLGNSPSGTRRVQVTAEFKIPSGIPIGGYSTNFGIKTQ